MPPKECIKGFEHKIVHDTNCGLYYECLINGQRIEKACTYPMQFDILFGECKPYDQVDCGNRREAKDLCLLLIFICLIFNLSIYKYFFIIEYLKKR